MDIGKIGLGCVTFGREIDESESLRILDFAAENGITHFDTASAYAEGQSEKIIGQWLKSNADRIGSTIIATKVLPPYSGGKIREVVENSLLNLGTGRIDLFYLHNRDVTATSPEVLQSLDRLVREGKIKEIGVSNFTQSELESALVQQDQNGWTRFRAIQNNFNYAVSDLDWDFREFCKREKVRVISYSPLGAGFLTGKHKREVESKSRFDIVPGHQDVYFHETSWSRLAHLEKVAERTGQPQAHLALAWAMHQPGIDTVLVGGRKKSHIEQALKALEFKDATILGSLDGE